MQHVTDAPADTAKDAAGSYVDELTISRSRRAELIEESRQSIVSRLSEIVASALEQMSDELSALAEKREDVEEQRALLDAVGVVRLNRREIEQRFRSSFSQLFQQRLHNTQPAAEQQEQSEHELALVDDAFTRDKLKVQRLIEQTRGRLDPDEVLGMRARLAALVNRDWFDEDRHPASPEAVFEALKLAVDEIAADSEAKSALLEAFAPYVADQLNTVYSSVNEHLRGQQVLPKIKARVAINPDTGRPYKPGEQVAHQDDEALEDPERETFVLPRNGPEREAILEALAREVSAGGQEARTSAVQMLTEPENFGVADLPMPEADTALIDALDTIQTQGRETPAEATDALKGLTEKARETGSPLDQLTVEIVSLIFDFLYQDPRIDQPIKNQLLRLQVVAVKAALLDRSFFASRQHPMRRLIDRTTDLSSDPEIDSSEEGDFTRQLSDLISTILAEFDRDLGVFERAVAKLDLIEAAENERRSIELAELTREAEEEETQDLGREQAIVELEARCDMLTPEFIQVFLMEWWVEVMVAACLEDRARGNGNCWAARLETAEQLLWTVSPKSSVEVKQMAVMLPKMISGLANGLKSIAVQDGQHARFFDELMKWHTKVISQAKSENARAEPSTGSLAMREDGSVQFTGHVPELAHEPTDTGFGAAVSIDQLSRGQRFELRLEGIAPIAVKLAFISPARKLFALSRFPDFAQSFERDEFVQMLQDEELVLIEDKASIDRAIAAVGGTEPPPDRIAGQPARSGEFSDTLSMVDDHDPISVTPV